MTADELFGPETDEEVAESADHPIMTLLDVVPADAQWFTDMFIGGIDMEKAIDALMAKGDRD